MRYAIIAAGEGSRLREEGILTPKPLLTINGEALIDRLIRIFMANNADEIIVICNDLYPEVAEHLKQLQRQDIPLQFVVRTTASSMHSLYEIAPLLRGKPFILTTVDTYFDEKRFSDYVNAFQNTGAEGMMAVTDYCDDEKPLFVVTKQNVSDAHHDTQTEPAMITAFLDKTDEKAWISAGIYGLKDKALLTLERCIKEGQSRMRNFQRALIADGQQLLAYPLGKVVDIDHARDIEKLKGGKIEKLKPILGIYRAKRFSPGSADKDRAILDAALEVLRKEGYNAETITEEELLSGRSPLGGVGEELIVSMARSEEALKILEGTSCINAPKAVRSCNHRLYITDTTTEPPLWVKRTDQCRSEEGDVVFCPDREAVNKAIKNLKTRGITEYVCQRHYEGRWVKFYGVRGTSFFFPQEESTLRETADSLAESVGLQVYGGDAIIGADGTAHIVDLNDFPSFSACREEAAEAIAQITKQSLLNV